MAFRLSAGALVIAAAAAAITRIDDFDVWTHLALGRDLVQRGAFPAHEPFSFAAPSFYYNTEWLFECLMYLVYRAAGFPGVTLLKAGLIALTFVVLWKDSRPRDEAAPAVPGALIVRLAVLMWIVVVMRYRFVERPDVVVMLFLAFTIFALNSYLASGRRYLFLLPAVQIVWANVHPSLVIGAVPFIAVLGGGVALHLLSRVLRRHVPGMPSWRQLSTIAGVFAAVLACTLLNPYTWDALTLPFHLADNPWHRQEILELQPPTPATFPSLYVLIAALAVALVVTARGWPVIELLLVLPFIVLALSGVRFVFLLQLVAAPIIARSFSGLVQGWERPRVRRAAFATAGAAAGAAVVALVLAVAQLAPFAGGQRVAGLGVNEALLPEGALRYLDARHIEGRVFNSFHWGGYITWRDFPRRAAIVDGRGHAAPRLLEEMHFARVYPGHLDRIADEYGIDVAVVDYAVYSGAVPEEVVGREADLGIASPRWALVYWDDVALVYLRRTPRHAATIEADQYRWARPANGAAFAARQATDPRVAGPLRAELARNLKETASSTSALLLGAVAATPVEAIAALERVRHPLRTYEADQLLAAAHWRAGDRARAREYYDRALRIQESGQVLYNAGLVTIQAGQYRDALTYLERARRRDPDSAPTLRLLRDTYRVVGDAERAAALGPALERAETASRVRELVQRARSLLAAGRIPDAEAEVDAALKLEARNPGALTTLGYVRLHQGRLDEAIATLRGVAERDPSASNAHYGLAQVYAQTGNAAESERHLREFVRLVPRSYEAWRARERLAAASGQRS